MGDLEELLPCRLIEGRFDGLGPRALALKGSDSVVVEVMDGVAHGLAGTAKVLGDLRDSSLATTAPQQLCATQREAIGGA